MQKFTVSAFCPVVNYARSRACIQTFSRQSIALVLTLSGNWSLEAR